MFTPPPAGRIVVFVGNRFPSGTSLRGVPMAVSAVVGVVLAALVALVFTATDWSGLAWAAVPVSGLAGWLLVRVPKGPGRTKGIIGAALVFATTVSLGSVLLFMLATMASALMPGSSVSRPETPVGYLISLMLALVSVTPFLAVPAFIVGTAWAVLVRRIAGGTEATA